MWSELPAEILVNVFMCLDMLDLIVNVSRTCRSWRAACKDPALWKRVDLTAVRPNLTNISERPYAWSDEASAIQTTRFMKGAMNLSCGATSCLIYHFYVHTRAEDLIYAAMRTPKLKRVVLPSLNQGNIHGFVEAAKHWKDLESLTVPCIDDPATLMRTLGEHCKKLSHLKLVCPLKHEFAQAICAHVPQLKALSLRYTLVYTEALLHVLKTLRRLEVLNLCHVLMVDVVQRDGGESQVLLRRELGTQVLARASKLRGFVTCHNRPCVRCNGPVGSPEEIARWYESEEESWRFDEAPDFRI